MQLPSIAEYERALCEVLPDAPPSHVAMLEAHYRATNRKITATELANAASYSNYSAANLQYGKFSRRLCEALSFVPPIGNSGEPTVTYVLAFPSKISASDWEWTMHSEVAQALQALGVFADGDAFRETGPVHPEELPPGREYIEGAKHLVTVNAYERSRKARDECLAYWGAVCAVCEMDFESRYGAGGERCIHVHHLKPLASIRTEYQVHPIDDLRPVCPNCHSVLHTVGPPMSIAELRTYLRNARG